MLKIKNLSAEIEGKKILNDLSLEFEKGKVYAIMGKNGSGKSTLANVIIGNPKYNVLSGKISLNKTDITSISPDKRAKLGLFMSFQLPKEIAGVTIFDFLRTAYNALNKKISILQFQKLLNEKCNLLGLEKDFPSRYLNQGFSGGEKKKSEMLQMLVLNPKILIFDEIDSGLDIDALRTISESLNKFKKQNPDSIIIIISHYKRIFNYIAPDKVFILSEGKIIHESGKDIIDKIEEQGYSVLKK